jgi:probable HAF family extracellular repeat protein
MMPSRHVASALSAIALALALETGGAEAAAPSGTAFLIELPPEALATAQGANGFVVGGTFLNGGAFHWMPTAGVTDIGGVQSVAVSADGKTIVGRALDTGGFEEAAIWTGGKTWRLLGSVGAQRPCDQLVSGAFGASDSGRVVVGLAWDGCSYARAFRWEESTGMVDLGSLSGRSTRANGTSADGRVVVGWEQDATGFRKGAKWVDGREELIPGPSGFVGEAFDANRDGSLIVGAGCDPASVTGPAAWTWTSSAGLKCFPVALPAWVPAFAYQVYMQHTSEDGRVIGGAVSFGLDAEAVAWFDGEPVFVRDYLRAHGVPEAFQGWINSGFVTGVSVDGRTLVGYGAGPRTFQGWMVLLPELDRK